jgi:hypothetical protein
VFEGATQMQRFLLDRFEVVSEQRGEADRAAAQSGLVWVYKSTYVAEQHQVVWAETAMFRGSAKTRQIALKRMQTDFHCEEAAPISHSGQYRCIKPCCSGP